MVYDGMGIYVYEWDWVQGWALYVMYANSKLEIDQEMHNDNGPPWPPHYKNY